MPKITALVAACVITYVFGQARCDFSGLQLQSAIALCYASFQALRQSPATCKLLKVLIV